MVTWQNIELKELISKTETETSIVKIEQPMITNQKENAKEEIAKVSSNTNSQQIASNMTDNEIISYVDSLDKEVSLLTSTKDLTTSTKTKLKETFITLTDFIFYNGTIKEITFKELSTSAKEKVLEIYTRIDQKIESVWPNYKETIQTASKRIYTDVKDKAMQLKEKLQQKYKDAIGEDAYHNSTQIFEENLERFKENTAPTTTYIKEKSKETYEMLKEKANNWYQNLKESSE